MQRATVFIAVLVFVLLPALASAEPSFDDIDDTVREAIVKVNGIMVEKDRDKALDQIEQVIEMLDQPRNEAQTDVRENLVRLKYYLSKYNWDRSRRVLKGIMEDLSLDYQPTYP